MITIKKNLQKLNVNQILDLSKFVVSENFNHHSSNVSSKEYENDVNSIFKEESNFYKNSQIFVAKDSLGLIKGSIRILRWNYIDTLPIEKIFGINPLEIPEAAKANGIYHIGRLAISKEVKDMNLFKKLIVCAISPICQDENNISFAEMDRKLLRILTLLKVEAKIIGKPIQYLGSETIPVSMDYKGLINFYNTNKSLVSDIHLSSKESSLALGNTIFDPQTQSAIPA